MATREIEVKSTDGSLSALVDAARSGDEVLLVSEGQPVARVVPIQFRRTPGSAKGLFTVPDDFDEPLDDFHDYM